MIDNLKAYFKHILFYLVFFASVYGFISIAVGGSKMNNPDGTPTFGFYCMFLGMMAFWVLLAAIRWFDFYDEMEAPHRTVTKIIGIAGAVGALIVQMIIRFKYESWGIFSCYFTGPTFEKYGNDPTFHNYVSLLLVLSGLVGYCFFSQFTDATGGKVVEITTYFDADGFEIGQTTSAPFTPVWGAILLGLGTTIIPMIICAGGGIFFLLSYFVITLIRHKSKRSLVWNIILAVLISIFAAVASIAPSFL